MKPTVIIILLNWNGWQDTIECVESCRKLTYPNFRILIVDNGSTDDSESVLRNRFPDITLIQTGNNLGFAGGNNVGIRYALEQDPAYIWLLNNDTVVQPEALSNLFNVAEQNEKTGMVGSKIYFFDDPYCIWYAGAFIDSTAPYRSGHRGLNELDNGQYDEIEETGFVTGCSLLARREMIEEIGLLDESFFLYAEDSDWNARARKAKWKLLYSPKSIVLHKVSSSIGGICSPMMRYYLARNLLYLVAKNYPSYIGPAIRYDLFYNVLVAFIKGRFSAAWWGLNGIIDFMRNRTGAVGK